jgi:hypothetical protein
MGNNGGKMSPKASKNQTVFGDESNPQLSAKGKPDGIVDEKNIIISETEEQIQ